MPEKSRGSVSARLTVWFSRVSASRKRGEIRVRAPRSRRGRAPRAPPRPRRGGARRASSCRPRRARARRRGSRTRRARPRPPTRAPRFLQCSRPATIRCSTRNRSPSSAKTIRLPSRRSATTRRPSASRERRRDRAQQERARRAAPTRALTDDARLERGEIAPGCRAAPARHRSLQSGRERGPLRRPMNVLARYTRWLHTRWPAGTVEKLPEVREDGTTAVPGVRIVGDLTGIPLLKFSSDTGARAVRAILAEPEFRAAASGPASAVLDLAIVGGGVSGIAAAIEAKKAGLDFARLRGGRAVLDRRELPEGQADLHLPDGHDARRATCSSAPRCIRRRRCSRTWSAQRRAAGVEVTSRADRADRARAATELVLHHARRRRRSRTPGA